MDIAKFCPAAQGWSTPELVEPVILLRRRHLTKQEEDHATISCAMPLRRFPHAGTRPGVNRLTVVTGKNRINSQLG